MCGPCCLNMQYIKYQYVNMHFKIHTFLLCTYMFSVHLCVASMFISSTYVYVCVLHKHGRANMLVFAHLCRCQWVGGQRAEDSSKRRLYVPLLINTMWSAKQQRTAAELPGKDLEYKSTAHNWSELVLRADGAICFGD